MREATGHWHMAF